MKMKKLLITCSFIILSLIMTFSECFASVFYTTGPRVHIWSEPNLNSEILTIIDQKGTEVNVSGNSGSWYQVSYGGQSGYIFKSSLKTDDPNAQIIKSNTMANITPSKQNENTTNNNTATNTTKSNTGNKITTTKDYNPNATDDDLYAKTYSNGELVTGGGIGDGSYDDISFSNDVTSNYSGFATVKTSIGLSGVLSRVGKQTPDACLTYALRYANKIFQTSSVKKLSSAQQLASDNKQAFLYVLAKEVSEGRPCVIRVNGRTKKNGMYSRHFVTVVGVKKTANMSNLQESDFLILDPSGARTRTLGSTRFLLKRENDVYHKDSGSSGYYMQIFNNASVYTSNPLIKTGSL